MTELPAPLVSSEVDLRDYDFMPLYGKKLFESDTWMLCDDIEKIAALRLWWASWHQEPAGSLPNNDRLLCGMAGKGDVLKAWSAVKKNAMRGWIECSDGRLYHPTVAAIALDVWRTKRKKVADNSAERERKRLKRSACPADTGGLSAEIPAENALKEKRKEEVEGERLPATSEPRAVVVGSGCPAENLDHESVRENFIALRERFWPDWPNPSAPWMTIESEARGWLEQGGTIAIILEILERGMREKAKAGETPPLSLKAFKLSLQDGIARANRKAPTNTKSPSQRLAERNAADAAAIARAG